MCPSVCQVSVNGDVYDVGTVLEDNSSSVTSGIVRGIIGALVVALGIALIVVMHLKRKRRGKRCRR